MHATDEDQKYLFSRKVLHEINGWPFIINGKKKIKREREMEIEEKKLSWNFIKQSLN